MNPRKTVKSESTLAPSAAIRFTTLETKLDSFVTSSEQKFTELTNALNRFADNVDRRFNQIESEQQQAMQKFNDEQRTHGKVNWTALGVIATVIGAVAILYVNPIKDRQQMDEQQAIFAANANDAREARDLSQIRDFIAEQARGVKDQLLARQDVADKRIDDVTARVDRRADQDRSELDEYRRMYGHPPASK